MTEAIAMRSQMEREQFSAAVRGEEFKPYVLGQLRLAYRRARLEAQAIHEAAKMIEAGVDVEMALALIGDAMDYVIPMPSEKIDTSDIPEVGEDWFAKAKLVNPEDRR